MSRGLNQPLLTENELKPIAIALSLQLEKITFEANVEDNLNAMLATQKAALLSGELLPSLYCQNEVVIRAMTVIENRNRSFLPGLFDIWYKQAHTFSTFQRMLLTLSSLILLVAAALSREAFVLLLDGKPKLKATGAAIADYCTTGLSEDVVLVCAELNEGMTAVFNMNAASRVLPSYSGEVGDIVNGPIPSTALQTIPSWFNPVGWVDFFTCTLKNNVTEMVGHAYFGSMQDAIAKASNVFPVATSSIPVNPNVVTNFIELMVLIPLFLAGFCIKIQEGGYSDITNSATNQYYGHFDGYERGATSFEQNGYAFAGTYGGITGVALLTAMALLGKKAGEKWDHSREARNEFHAVRSASALFKAFGKKLEEVSHGLHSPARQF